MFLWKLIFSGFSDQQKIEMNSIYLKCITVNVGQFKSILAEQNQN